MLFSGYLTIRREIADNVFLIRIPNKEIMSFFHNTFVEIIFRDSGEGEGRPDIVLKPFDRNRTGYVMELKTVKKGESIESNMKEAENQLKTKYYEADLEKSGIKDIVKIAIVFQDKKVIFKYID